MKVVDLPYALRQRRQTSIFDDFWGYASAAGDCPWTTNKTAVGGEGVAVSTTLLGGQLVLTTGGTASNEAGFASTVQGWKASAGYAFEFEMALQYVDANSHDCGFYFGLSDVLNATGSSGPLTAAAAAFKSSFTGFGFGKFKTDTNWRVISSVTTTQITNVTSNLCDDASGSSVHTFRIEGHPVSSTVFDVVYLIDGKQCLDNTTLRPIKHSVTVGATAMFAGALAKAGGGNSQTPAIDYISVTQLQRQTIQ